MITRGHVSPPRTCSKCGASRPSSQMRVITGRWICDWHQYYIAPETLAKAPITTFKIKPLKDARPFESRDTYEKAEWILLEHLIANFQSDSIVYNLLAGGRPVNDGFTSAGVVGGSSGVLGAGWTGAYLYSLIAEGRRPVRMINRAKAALAAVADWLLTRIYAYPGRVNGITNADHRWGGFFQNGLTTGDSTINTHHVAAAGLALLRAYQVHGTPSYLDGARATVWYCRSAQCGGKLASGFSSSDSAGTARIDYGAFTLRASMSGATPTFDHRYAPASLTALELYQAFLSVVGNETVGSSDTSGAYSQSRAAALSDAIAAAVAFWENGCLDATLGVTVTGLSTATPYDSFNAFPSSKGSFAAGTGSWRYLDAEQSTGTTIDGLGWALGIRALRAVEGNTSRVTSLFDWVMTFTSNPSTELAADSERAIHASPNGTFDPKVSWPSTMTVRDASLAPVRMNANASYHLGATGALASLYSSRQQASFKDLKDNLNKPRPRSRSGLEDGSYHYLAVMGRCGLSLQPRTATTDDRRDDIYAGALAGLIYREAPVAFGGVGRP